jgi:hypothetical protein
MSVPPPDGLAVAPEAEHIDKQATGRYRDRMTRPSERFTQTTDRM